MTYVVEYPAQTLPGASVPAPPYLRYVAPPPAPLWYERLPLWVSVSLFLHGLAIVIFIALIGAPGAFGLADEGDTQRALDAAASNDRRILSLEAQVGATRGTGTAQPGVDSSGLDQRIAALESRVSRLCAASNPPC